MKALYRRAKAYRALDEYKNASTDLVAALENSPGDAGVIKEMAALQGQKQGAAIFEREMASNAMNAKIAYNSATSTSTATSIFSISSISMFQSTSASAVKESEGGTRGVESVETNTRYLLEGGMPIEPVLPRGVF